MLLCLCAGRQFYKCAKFDGGCDFFLWADAAFNAPSNDSWSHPSHDSRSFPHASHGTQPPHNTHPRSSHNTQRGGSTTTQGYNLTCRCGLEAVQRTVQKDGPNRGKMFNTCPKPREEQCGYFEWCDEGTPSSRGRGRGRGRGEWGQQRETGDGVGKQRLCSVCRQPGHTKRTCPQSRMI